MKAPRPPTWQELQEWLFRTVLFDIGPYFSAHSGSLEPANRNDAPKPAVVSPEAEDGDRLLAGDPQGNDQAVP